MSPPSTRFRTRPRLRQTGICLLHSALAGTLSLVSCTVYKSHFPANAGTGSGPSMVLPAETGGKQGLHYFLPRSHLQLVGQYVETKDTSGTVVDRQFVTTVSKINQADGALPLFAEITENALYDEASTLKAPDGLLTSSVTKPEDKTAEIIQTVASTIFDAAAFAARLNKVADTRVAHVPLRVPSLVKPFKEVIDPLDPASRDPALARIAANGIYANIENLIDAPPGTLPQEALKAPRSTALFNRRSKKPATLSVCNGLVYRRPHILRVKFAKVDGFEFDKARPSLPTNELTVPDPRTLAMVPIRRGFMSKRETSVTFVKGEPTEFDLKQPSPILGFVKLPAALVKAAGAAIPSIIQIKQDAPAQALKSQNDLLQMQIQQIKLENDLRQLQQARSAGL